MKFSVSIAGAAGILFLCTVAACEGIDSTVVREVIRYLESIPANQPAEKTFVTFDSYGSSEDEGVMKVYGWQLYNVFELTDDQVQLGEGGSYPVVVLLRREDDGWKAVGFREPDDGVNYWPSIKKMFPEEYWEKALGRLPRHLLAELRDRVTSYYADRLSPDRFAEMPVPSDTNDPHRHNEPIYDYLNLRAIYEKVRIEENPVRVVRTGGGEPVSSTDSCYTAWIGVRDGFHMYFEENATGEVHEIVYRTDSFFSDVTWKRDHVLVFDLKHGSNTFGEGKSYGVHIELDVEKKEIIWAVPYGPLGFPQKRADMK